MYDEQKWMLVHFIIKTVGQHHDAELENYLYVKRMRSFPLRKSNMRYIGILPHMLVCQTISHIELKHERNCAGYTRVRPAAELTRLSESNYEVFRRHCLQNLKWAFRELPCNLWSGIVDLDKFPQPTISLNFHIAKLYFSGSCGPVLNFLLQYLFDPVRALCSVNYIVAMVPL